MTRIEDLSVNGYTVYANDIEEPYTVIEPWPSNKVHAVWTLPEVRRIVGYSRAQLVAKANEGGRLSRVPGAPHLTPESSRETLIAWLAWNDPNGSHTDEDAIADGIEPYDLDSAWETLASFYAE